MAIICEQEKRALREIEVLCRLAGNPFCCQLYDCFYSACGTYIYMVLEKAEEDFNDLLARMIDGHLPEDAVRSVPYAHVHDVFGCDHQRRTCVQDDD